MKKLALTTAIILSVAAPVLAQSQLQNNFGPGLTVSEAALLADKATQTGGDARVYLGYTNTRFSTSNVHNSVAQSIFATFVEESRDDH